MVSNNKHGTIDSVPRWTKNNFSWKRSQTRWVFHFDLQSPFPTQFDSMFIVHNLDTDKQNDFNWLRVVFIHLQIHSFEQQSQWTDISLSTNRSCFFWHSKRTRRSLDDFLNVISKHQMMEITDNLSLRKYWFKFIFIPIYGSDGATYNLRDYYNMMWEVSPANDARAFGHKFHIEISRLIYCFVSKLSCGGNYKFWNSFVCIVSARSTTISSVCGSTSHRDREHLATFCCGNRHNSILF